MFDNLTSSLSRTLGGMRGRRLTERNIRDALREVRIALLEADVALSVVEQFLEDVRIRAIGKEFTRKVQPGEEIIGHVNDALVELLGGANEQLTIQGVQRPAVMLMAGVQGVGKTTCVAKLGKLLRERESKKVAVVSTDIYRPAAIDQLKMLAKQAEIHFVDSDRDQSPIDIANRALVEARNALDDVLIVDTAGRQTVDDELMAQIRELYDVLRPQETLFVIDAIMGQDAAATATAFNNALSLTGLILAKADGDARGGAALTATAITGKPIKFLGVGEGIDEIEPFHPERIASRILGMGDVLALLEQAERTIDKDQAQKLSGKLLRGRGLNLQDIRDQYAELQKIGGLNALQENLPRELLDRMAKAPNFDNAHLTRQIAIIDSMTKHERFFPGLLNPSRRKRIAAGSGTEIYEVNKLVRTFAKMSKRSRKIDPEHLLAGLSRSPDMDLSRRNSANKNRKKQRKKKSGRRKRRN